MPATCEVCGGTDFYKDAGFYFCNDCNTQTQDIQEHVFEDRADVEEDEPAPRTAPRRKSIKAKPNVEEHLTSWECYNYILLGLVNELIELGAHENLRSTVEVIWFHYLKNVEVIREDNAPPKLPAVNIDRDKAIIYGRDNRLKRKRSRSPSTTSHTDTSTLDKEAKKRERTTQKRALARQDYNEYLSSTQQSETSLANQSLSSLKSLDSSNITSRILQFNKPASIFLEKQMKKPHLKLHCRDVHSILDCHCKFTRRSAGAYYVDPSLLSRSKLFSLIYLGLLINKDHVQLGDMLRYVREGHLSFQHVDHFFPRESIEKKLNVCSFTKGPKFLTHSETRSYASKLASFLEIRKYIPVQNVVELCERYCQELNLPDCIRQHTLNIISRTLPKFPVIESFPIPNYEGRTISFIIFILKLLFGMDDLTEYEMSRVAILINSHSRSRKQEMFVFESWLTHIQYRHFIISQRNFGASFAEYYLDDAKLFIDHLDNYNKRYFIEKEEDDEIEMFKRLLNEMESMFEKDGENVTFNPSLTPYIDYLKILLNNNKRDTDFNEAILQKDFSNTSDDFLFYTELYLQRIFPSHDITYKHGGKNDDIQFINMFDSNKKFREKIRQKKCLHNITLLDQNHHQPSNFMSFLEETNNADNILKTKADSQKLIENYENMNEKNIRKNTRRRQKLFNRANVSLKMKENDTIRHEKIVIYEPCERFCASLQNVSQYNEEKWETLFEKFSLSFRILLKECARITEQSTKDVYMEYVKVETYLTHVLDIGKDRFHKEKVVNNVLKNNIKNIVKTW